MDEENVHAELVSALHGLQIEEIRDNNPGITNLNISRDVYRLSDKAWTLLGRYIANNTHLDVIHLGCCSINDNLPSNTDSNIFQGLTKSDSIKELVLESVIHNNFGAEGIRSMTSFLQNSPQFVKLNISGYSSMDTAAFEILVNILNGGRIKELNLGHCCITDISAFGNVTLPLLQKLNLAENSIQNIGNISTLENYTSLTALNLNKNNIGIDGCRAIAHLLQKEESNLTALGLSLCRIGDEGIEILVNSLKHNKKLKHLDLTAPRKSESKSQFNVTHSKLTFSCLTGTQDTIILSSGVTMKLTLKLAYWATLDS